MGEAERRQKIIQWATIVRIEIDSIDKVLPETVALKLVPIALADAKTLVNLILGEANESQSLRRNSA